MSNTNEFKKDIEGFRAPGARTPRPKTGPRGNEVITQDEVVPASAVPPHALKSIEIDVKEIGTAPTVLQHSTPPPPPPDDERHPAVSLLAQLEQEEQARTSEPDHGPKTEQTQLKPAFKKISVEFPTMVRVGVVTKLAVLGHHHDDKGFDAVNDFHCVDMPTGSIEFDEASGTFTPRKAGKVRLNIVVIDPITKDPHVLEDLELVVHPADEPKVILSDSLANLSAPATAAHNADAEGRKQREGMETISPASQLAQQWFKETPDGMTAGGTPIHRIQNTPEPTTSKSEEKGESSVQTAKRHPVVQMRSVTEEDVRKREHRLPFWLRAMFIGFAVIMATGFVMVGVVSYLLGHPLHPADLASADPAPSVPPSEATAEPTVNPTVPAELTPSPAPPRASGEPGLHGDIGSYVRASARAAYPTSCHDLHEDVFHGTVRVLCGLRQRHGNDICDCDVAGFIR
ncbi:MAG TPA: hypothetical protein VMU11_02375 [Verrucomicrobiae bacterium]|nr:hypothetical protein [Verrucomicrobiae bacterium]